MLSFHHIFSLFLPVIEYSTGKDQIFLLKKKREKKEMSSVLSKSDEVQKNIYPNVFLLL